MQTRKFDTAVQELKYQVIKELIRAYDSPEGIGTDIFRDIPVKIMPGPKASLRCCVYKERRGTYFLKRKTKNSRSPYNVQIDFWTKTARN